MILGITGIYNNVQYLINNIKRVDSFGLETEIWQAEQKQNLVGHRQSLDSEVNTVFQPQWKTVLVAGLIKYWLLND